MIFILQQETGILYICGTPIGNLEDITIRALDILKNVDLIAAEDTRRTLKLLNHFEIKKPLDSYHEHNEREKAEELITILLSGKSIALVSDAGMPGISDPGLEIVKSAIEKGINVIPVPGPTAAISALVVSGIPADRFAFEGFLPRKGKERQRRLDKLRLEERTMIIYESPYRIKDTLQELEYIFKDRQMALIRELTKIHEEKIYGTAAEILKKIREGKIKGEIVLIIAGNQKLVDKEEKEWEELSLLDHVKLLMEKGMTKKQAIRRVARTRDASKREVYREAIVIDARTDNHDSD
ncbi:MAG: 16S rRNA (cytidine(1402)-2'-O)-methyltransferase [Halanaerobiaceae bacterium]